MAAAFLASGAPAHAADDEPPAAQGPYFYKGYDYGSQALYNPLWVFLNRGYDVLQIHTGSRDIFRIDYATGGRNVAENLFVHPVGSVRDEGWKKFFREEIFPLSFTRDTARWIPNYTLHLIGGGVTFTSLREWSAAQGIDEPFATAIAAGTILGSAFVNETLENGSVVGRNTDAIADFWFFDLGGMLLFSIDGVNRFFSSILIVDDWSLQPTFTSPHGELHDQGNYFAAKLPLPLYPRLRLFGYYGLGTMGGLSYQVGRGYSVSAGFGSKVTRLVSHDAKSVDNGIAFAPSGGLFIDRNESLLASVQVSDAPDYFVQANVYPNALFRSDLGFGFWTAVAKDGAFAAGISITRALGVGVGMSGF